MRSQTSLLFALLLSSLRLIRGAYIRKHWKQVAEDLDHDRVTGAISASHSHTHTSYSECIVTELHGLTPPGAQHHIQHRMGCHEISTERMYQLTGDYKSLLKDIDISYGTVRIRFPSSAIVNRYSIDCNDKTLKDIEVTYDDHRRKNRRNRNLQTTSSWTNFDDMTISEGTFKVLIVRLSNDWIDQHKISQGTVNAYNKFFNDSNNLKKVYNRCSRGKLNLIPATGNGVTNGVMTVHAPYNICDMDWKEAGDYAITKILNTNNIDHRFRMIIMPDCVDFDGAAAWANSPGSTSYLMSMYASLPVTQVHEFGHNLGHKHSGKDGVRYADDTGYMGNRATWSDEGSMMCFNPAKMWVFGWYSEWHRTVNVLNVGFSGQLVGINDAKNQPNIVSDNGQYVFLRLKSGKSRLFIAFNQKKGINEGVVGDGDKIVITEQDGRFTESVWKAGLGVGEIFEYWNWNGSGKTLVVENCGIRFGSPDYAHIIAYTRGSTDVSCPEVTVNNNTPNNDVYYAPPPVARLCESTEKWWYDIDGEGFNCDWYSQSNRCRQLGNQFENFGMTANEACCACLS